MGEEKKNQVKIDSPCGFLFLNQDLISFFSSCDSNLVRKLVWHVHRMDFGRVRSSGI